MPSPKPPPIQLSQRQQAILEKIARRQSSSQQLVRGVKIILNIAEDKNNQQVAKELDIHRETVRQWRKRWLAAQVECSRIEATAEDKGLRQRIEGLLADEQRPGTPAQFSWEQIVEILAIASEAPEQSGYPLSHWRPQAVRTEAIKRKMVVEISLRQLGRFFQRGCPATPASSLLAQCPSGRA